ncbi:uncharacterized protein PHACADRAFT_117701 [Phanerochaete carnosa HHB-10118-sp]|uniref:Enoyl reductase (ER) domain-containing protein n=1 Tax=Phanerochaete carnosa (strain HHB-10118-sp) TaxID=650164 RepID=K5V780_PHACS|nr:uncharacterized protein PHACADRAFT_117701 [Phanerochaete carnosa HHB-10118-sp]EKM58621.1 hypothetical protein PHACADRAFT_117701 [Phanerochaete carnosa HHB-10118-sp]
MTSKQQKTLFCSNIQGTYSVELIDVPELGPGEVLVELQAVGLNPIDWFMRERGLFVPKWPAIFGLDGAGVVIKVGEGVANIEVGDRVMHAGTMVEPKISTFLQYAAIKADFVAKVPDNISLDEASTIPLVLATAALGLYDSKRSPHGGLGLTPPWEKGGRGKYADEPIVINAGSTSVGQFLIQFAKISGFSPIITTASRHNEEYLKSLGATHIIDRTIPLSSLPSAVHAITEKPIVYGADAISTAETQNAMCDVVAPGGDLLIVTHKRIAKEKLEGGEKHIAWVFADVQYPSARPCGLALYANMTGLLERGEIKVGHIIRQALSTQPNRIKIVSSGLAGIPGALDTLKSGVSALKLVVRPQETP